MSYVKIEDLTWDAMPGGTLVSMVQLWGEGDSAETPNDPENPFTGPGVVEYRIVDGKISATKSGVLSTGIQN